MNATAIAHDLAASTSSTDERDAATSSDTSARNDAIPRLAVVAFNGPAANTAPPTTATTRKVDPAKYLGFVERIARRMSRNIPANIELEDLIGAGTLGLLEAVDRYDPAKSDRFETFAEFRIKGAIYDELRRYDLMARNARLAAKRLTRTQQSLTAKLGRPPVEEEVAAALDMTLAEYRKLVARVGNVRVLGLDDLGNADSHEDQHLELAANDPSPEDQTASIELGEQLTAAIGNLTERQQTVLHLYYQREMTLKEIGARFGVTESRICQIIRETTTKLRGMLDQPQAA